MSDWRILHLITGNNTGLQGSVWTWGWGAVPMVETPGQQSDVTIVALSEALNPRHPPTALSKMYVTLDRKV